MSKRVYGYCLILFFSVNSLIAGRYFNESQAEKIYRAGGGWGNIRIPCYIRIDKGMDCVDPKDERLMSAYETALKQKITHTKKIFIHISEKDYKNKDNWKSFGEGRTEL